MRIQLLVALISSLIFVACSNDDEKDGGTKSKIAEKPCQSNVEEKSIYGSDDRKDWSQVKEKALLTWAKATVALIQKSDMKATRQVFKLQALDDQTARGLCSDQPFLEQPTAAFCSGFFVGNDLIVTAGHCLLTAAECKQTAFIFDYAIEHAGDLANTVPAGNVYGCKKLVSRKDGADDYAIVQLDRPVVGRVPFEIRRTGSPSLGEPLVMIGHPVGLPSKIAEGGSVLAVNSRIVADVDAFGGNSGSVVIDRNTGRVEGILVSGNADFDKVGSCHIEHRCGTDCDGEKIYAISKIATLIPKVINGSTSENGAQLSPICSTP